MTCKNESNAKSSKSTRKTFQWLVMFTNVFLLSSETFSPTFILRSTLSTFSSTFTCPLAILPNIVVIVAVKTKRQPRSKSSVPLACLAATLFAAGLIFFNLRVPEWKVDNTKASWNDELQTTCARRKWSRKMVVWLRPWLKTLRSLLSSTNDLLCYSQIMLKRTRKS